MARIVARGSDRVVPGTPRWAVMCAWAALGSVVPSAIWRTLVGVGVPLGWSDAHLELEQIPGFGTAYVIALSLIRSAQLADICTGPSVG